MYVHYSACNVVVVDNQVYVDIAFFKSTWLIK
jgi:hypothetical protein